jgi:hypothetical protein
MRLERIVRALGGGEEFDSEPVEQRTRAERVGREPLGDAVEIQVARRRIERDVEPEHLGEDVIEPRLRRRAAEQVVVTGERAPGLARVGIGCAVTRRHTEAIERDALAVEHAEQIMVGRQQQAGRVAPARVGREPARIGMAVRRNDRQRRDLRIERACDRALVGIAREQPVGRETKRAGHRDAAICAIPRSSPRSSASPRIRPSNE